MLRNYFKTTWRSLHRNQSYTLLNLAGLTLGLSIAIVLFWIIRFEYSFDRYHAQANRLYRIIEKDKYGEKGSHVPQGVINALNRQVPGVSKAANVYAMEPNGVQVGRRLYNLKYVFFAPPQFLEMIDVTWLKGSARLSLSQPYQVVLDEPTARRFFKDGNAVGQTIRFQHQVDLTVSGIIQKMPVNSEFQFQMVASRETLKRIGNDYADEAYWGRGNSMHHGYVLLKPGTAASSVEKALTTLARQYTPASTRSSYELLPLVELHRDTQSDADPYNYVLPQWMLHTLMGIGLFLMLMACINFINLATVQATQRSREIAVRKVLGSSRLQLMAQFFGETALLVFTSIGVASLIATQLIQYADRLLTTQVAQTTVWDYTTGLFLSLLGVVVTVLAGGYPAVVLSGFQPVRIVRGQAITIGRGKVKLRQTLVVFQFVIAQVLVICTLIGTKQIHYFYQTDLGFDKEAVVTVNMPDRGSANLRERLRQQVMQYPEIKDVAFGLTTPSSSHNWWWELVHHPNLPDGEATFRMQYVDTNYFRFFGIPLVAGRSWAQADTHSVVILNEKAVRDLGFASPQKALGKRINLYYNQPFTIMGVVKDYHSQSLRSTIVPHAFVYAGWNFQTASIRIDPKQPAKALAHIRQHWQSLFPTYYFEPNFLDQEIKSFYDDERKLANFLTLLAVVDICIGCLGLFGLVSFVVRQRTKEIGLRKVLGATVVSLVTLLSQDFLKLVLIAFIIATPIAYYIMSRMLQTYQYKIGIEWTFFAIAGVLAAGIALLTVSIKAITAALTNPVQSLRS